MPNGKTLTKATKVVAEARSKSNEQYSEQETVERREAALKRLLATPHKPHAPLGKRKQPL